VAASSNSNNNRSRRCGGCSSSKARPTFQPVSQDGDGQPAYRPAPAHQSDKPAASNDGRHGGHGGTPVGRLKNGTDTPGETKSYIDEASMNVDA